ncbi:hypothetical protein [Fusobacterium perfoetens]|uniref:hypothetical protein n=1 Tax=Fusobacterium perfoetens TaxID=852 RepID=UPI0026F00448|nr:hypothetical protein [Fusobacterium perfoetens]
MKKLLMMGAILAMGAMAFGADDAIDEAKNVNEATVTVKAKLVVENLVITDLEGNPIVLDFGRVSKTRTSGTSEAQTGYMVRFVGTETLNESNNALEMTLLNKTNGNYEDKAVPVTLSALTQVEGQKADTFDVTVGLNSYTGKMPTSKATGHDYAEYTGIIFGTLDHNNANANGEGDTLVSLASGDYQGETMLRVTINGGADFE